MKQKEDKMPRKERGAKDASPAKEHKPSWQEKYASPEEIEQMLSSRVLLRYNEVRITPEERKQRAVSMGYDAWKQQVSAASKDTDVTDVTDVS